mgnify:CR=1 FL=1
MNEREKDLLTPEEKERRQQVRERQRRQAREEKARKKKRAERIKLIIGTVFVTLLTAAAVFIVFRYVFPSADKPVEQPQTTTPSVEQTTEEATTEEPTTAGTTSEYPELKSKNGTFSTYSSGAIRVDNAAFGVCGKENDGLTSKYAALVSEVADSLKGKTKVYDLVIPTAYGITLPDDIRRQIANYADQEEIISKIFAKLSKEVAPVYCCDNLMTHRDEYLYFRTDHHWNGRGAYYAYEAFCRTKGIEPYPLEKREKKEFDGFLGTMYQNNGRDENLLPADTVEAFLPVSKNAVMKFTKTDGSTYEWPIIKDVSGWSSGAKYNTFAGSDNPITEFTNPDVTDGSVLIVVKESFGNALLPYLVDHYSKIYEIDYRYWSGNLVSFAEKVGADDILFANHILMPSTGLLVGNLSKIIK